MSGTATPPEGWYNDPSQPGSQRYWDGAAWTHNTRPLPSAAVVAVADVAVEEVGSAVEEAPPPWAAEVVAAEAASYNTHPWWNQPKFVAPLLLLVGIVALVAFVGLRGGNDDTEVSSGGEDDQARAIVGPDNTETQAAAPDDDQIATDGETAASSTTTTNTEPPAASVASPAGATDATPSEDSDDTTDTAPDSEVASQTQSTTTTAAEGVEEPTSTTATTEAAVSVEGVSTPCLAAMQDAAAVPDEVDVPEDLFPTFASCASIQEWTSAAEATDISNRVDVATWVPTGCVLNAEFYDLPLCTSAIDPDSGPRRIDCADGREEIEWVFVDDDRSNSQVCADHFQIQCNDGTIHNIPSEALSEEEAQATICA